MLPKNTVTIQEFIDSGASTLISYKSFSFLETMSNGTVVSVHDVISDYIEDIKKLCLQVQLDSDEYRKYIYKPKLLCNDLYDAPELYFIILLVNDMTDVKEFNRYVINMPPKSVMNSVITEIYNREKAAIKAYNDAYSGM